MEFLTTKQPNKACTWRVGLLLCGVRHFRAFFSLRVFSAPKQNSRPPQRDATRAQTMLQLIQRKGDCQVNNKVTLFLWVLGLFLAGCNSSRSASPSQGNLVKVSGYEMYLHCIGTGTPTVIMEAGYNDNSGTWSLVQPELAEVTRVCTYDRAGLGKSEPGPEPRDSYQIIKDLHTLLTNAGIEGPYVLVGHSLGGIYMRLFADYYPEVVVGLVLVDSAHVDDPRRSKEILPPESLNESESLRSIREYLANPLTFPEIPGRIFMPGSLGDMPLVVLSVPKQQRGEDLPVEFRDALDEIWVDLQEEWALISTRSTHILVFESSHFIQKDQPAQVIDAIKQVVEDARLD